MSLPQSNIDWARYMEGLEGKANVGLGNTTLKLADSFISKLMPDYSAGITLTLEQIKSGFTAIVNGVIISSFRLHNPTVNGYPLPRGRFSTPNGGSYDNQVSFFLTKGDLFKDINATVTIVEDNDTIFYPLKGAN